MSIRTILVPLTGEPGDDVALGTAALVARDAHLDAVFAGPRDNLGAARDAFGAACRDSSHATFRIETGTLAQVAGDASLFADLVVFPPLRAATRGPLRDAFIEVLTAVQCPLLLCAETVPAGIGARVAFGWDGGLSAAQALHAALPLLSDASAADLLTIGRDVPDEIAPADAVAFLALHGVTAKRRAVPAGPDRPGLRLLAAAMERDADLLVVGGYGHHRTFENVFGGVTQDILAHPRLPVLMAH